MVSRACFGCQMSKDQSHLLHQLAIDDIDDFTAEDAFKIGFVSRVSKSSDGLMGVANDVCRRITRNSPVAVAVTKSSLNYSRDHSVDEGLSHIALQNSSALMSEDLAKSFMMAGGQPDAQFAPIPSHSRL